MTTENEKLRALLKEARDVVAGTVSAQGLMYRIDSALGERQLSEDAISDQCIQEDAFARGAEAMREMAAAKADDKLSSVLRHQLGEHRARQAVTDAIRALPLPEDEE